MPTKSEYKKRKQLGVCVSCGNTRNNNTLKCNRCRNIISKCQKKRSEYRKQNSICLDCGKPAENSNFCILCIKIRKERDKKIRQKNLEEGICTRCKSRKALKSQERCARCKNKTSSNHITRKQERKDQGLCIGCGVNPVFEKFLSCISCLETRKQSLQETKYKVFNYYGYSCACCEEDIFEFLNIDHINGDGRRHLKQNSLGFGGSSLYQWLIRNNFPERFQTLCFNCNKAKFTNSACPHQYLKEKLCIECKKSQIVIFNHCEECFTNQKIGQKNMPSSVR